MSYEQIRIIADCVQILLLTLKTEEGISIGKFQIVTLVDKILIIRPLHYYETVRNIVSLKKRGMKNFFNACRPMSGLL